MNVLGGLLRCDNPSGDAQKIKKMNTNEAKFHTMIQNAQNHSRFQSVGLLN